MAEVVRVADLVLQSVVKGDAKKVAEMLSHGADIHTRYEHGATLLHWATRIPDDAASVQVVELLLNAGAKLDAITLDGQTPLQWAEHDENDAVALLLSSRIRREDEKRTEEAPTLLPPAPSLPPHAAPSTTAIVLPSKHLVTMSTQTEQPTDMQRTRTTRTSTSTSTATATSTVTPPLVPPPGMQFRKFGKNTNLAAQGPLVHNPPLTLTHQAPSPLDHDSSNEIHVYRNSSRYIQCTLDASNMMMDLRIDGGQVEKEETMEERVERVKEKEKKPPREPRATGTTREMRGDGYHVSYDPPTSLSTFLRNHDDDSRPRQEQDMVVSIGGVGEEGEGEGDGGQRSKREGEEEEEVILPLPSAVRVALLPNGTLSTDDYLRIKQASRRFFTTM